jgi:hypothetical protein
MYGPADLERALSRWRYVDLRVNTRVPDVRLPVVAPGHVTIQTLTSSMDVGAFVSGVAFYQLSECYWIPWVAILTIEDGTPLADTKPLRLVKGGQ